MKKFMNGRMSETYHFSCGGEAIFDTIKHYLWTFSPFLVPYSNVFNLLVPS